MVELMFNGSIRFEPIVSLKDGQVSAIEVLNPGVDDDIKNIGMIVDEAMRKEGILLSAKIHINVFPQTLLYKPDQLRQMVEYARQFGLVIVFELLETELKPKELPRLSQLIETYGLWFSIDDFGTLNSNIDRLESLLTNPFLDSLKIDRQFWNGNFSEITPQLVGKLKDKGIRVIAEKVETTEEKKKVKKQGFTDYQGYITAIEIQSFTEGSISEKRQNPLDNLKKSGFLN